MGVQPADNPQDPAPSETPDLPGSAASRKTETTAPPLTRAQAPIPDNDAPNAASKASGEPGGAGLPAGDIAFGAPGNDAPGAARAPVTVQAQLQQAADTARNAAIQIAEVVRASGELAVELRLHPEELGRVQVTMSQDASGSLTVSLNVERADTLDLLRRNIDQLAAELRQLGYGSVGFSFHGEGGRDGRGSENGAPAQEAQGLAKSATPDKSDATPVAGPSVPAASGDTIDMRL